MYDMQPSCTASMMHSCSVAPGSTHRPNPFPLLRSPSPAPLAITGLRRSTLCHVTVMRFKKCLDLPLLTQTIPTRTSHNSAPSSTWTPATPSPPMYAPLIPPIHQLQSKLLPYRHQNLLLRDHPVHPESLPRRLLPTTFSWNDGSQRYRKVIV